ncbi:MAG: thiamine-phosphate kinase [Rhizobiales bacterium]|nr:thiamine-phosphate kinase [Hyphomicrobiales bacterium]
MSSGEHDLIARYFRPLVTDPGAFGLLDDAAILKSSGDDLVVTTDAIVEGVHFLPGDPPDTVARKALRVNLSDLAAKGAVPAGFVLTLALREAADDWLAPFAKALGEDIGTFQCPLLGGDTVSTPGPLSISVTAFGHVPPGKMIRRNGAKPGDKIVVTGTIGDAAAGLRLLKVDGSTDTLDKSARDFLVDRYRVPKPRNALATCLRNHATAAMDISDGLAGDLGKLCAASGVSGTVDASSVPLSEPVGKLLRAGQISFEDIVAGGDDYELLCTIPENHWAAFVTETQQAKVGVTAIGSVAAGDAPPVFAGEGGRPIALKRLSYSHF